MNLVVDNIYMSVVQDLLSGEKPLKKNCEEPEQAIDSQNCRTKIESIQLSTFLYTLQKM